MLDEAWPALLDKYGGMTASVAADLIDEWMEGKAKLKVVRSVDEDRANARMRWALGSQEVFGNLDGLVDELTRQPARSTMISTAKRTPGAGWARVPKSDAKACAFCLMMASRGGDFGSEQSAKYVVGRGGRPRGKRALGKKFHDFCRCEPVLMSSPEDAPEGYDQDELYDQYRTAYDAGSGSTTDTLAKMREQLGIHH